MIDRLYDSMPLNYWHSVGFSAGMKNQIATVVSGFPVVGDIQRSIDNLNYYNDYMRNRGLDWADVKYPSRVPTVSLGSTLSFVSKNIDRLYERLFFYQTFYSFFFPRGPPGEPSPV